MGYVINFHADEPNDASKIVSETTVVTETALVPYKVPE